MRENNYYRLEPPKPINSNLILALIIIILNVIFNGLPWQIYRNNQVFIVIGGNILLNFIFWFVYIKFISMFFAEIQAQEKTKGKLKTFFLYFTTTLILTFLMGYIILARKEDIKNPTIPLDSQIWEIIIKS